MEIESFRIRVSESIGEVSGELLRPASPAAVLVLAHGAGANMHHRFMKALALALGERGIATVRYNFPYMEKERRGRPDPPAVAEKTVQAALNWTHQRVGALPILGGGKSFGGRMTSQRLSTADLPFVKGVVFFGFPLHPPGKPAIERAAHLQGVSQPMLFHQGTRDTLANSALMRKVTSELPRASHIEYEGADHSFKAGKRELIPELAQHTVDWLARTL